MEATIGTTKVWPVRGALAGAFGTVVTLLGGLAVGIGVGSLIGNAIPSHIGEPIEIAFSSVAATIIIALSSALWGVWMGRLAGRPAQWRMAWAGALGFTPITIGLVFLLLALEPVAIEQLGMEFPIHHLFTLMFVPTAFLIAATGSLAIGLGLKNARLGWQMAWRAGLIAAVTFLLVNWMMDALGWRVGGPNAEERMTMLVVMFSGDLAAALTAGAVVGWMVTRAKAYAE